MILALLKVYFDRASYSRGVAVLCYTFHYFSYDSRVAHQPWRESTDEKRLDPTKGLPLVASLDALFDAGLISFEDSGRMLVHGGQDSWERTPT